MIVSRLMSEKTRLQVELDRLREGLRRIKDRDYDRGYDPEDYAEAVLNGDEPDVETRPAA